MAIQQKNSLISHVRLFLAFILSMILLFIPVSDIFANEMDDITEEENVPSEEIQRILKFTKPNMLGPDVAYLQMLLEGAGYDIGDVDGVFGKKTEQTVKAVQERLNIEADGVVDQVFWVTFFDLLSSIIDSEIDEEPAKRRYILLDVDKRRLELYEGDEVIFSASVAVGKASTPTPVGYWKIVNKGKWSGGFGSRWMGLNVPWGIYGIHGTNKPESIGGALSHGCIRLYNRDVEKLYDLVSIGTMVKIVAGNFGLLGHSRPLLAPGERSSHVFAVQQNLSAHGYYNGPIDGIYGWGTETAIKNFQQDNNLPVTGRVDTRTYDALGLILFE